MSLWSLLREKVCDASAAVGGESSGFNSVGTSMLVMSAGMGAENAAAELINHATERFIAARIDRLQQAEASLASTTASSAAILSALQHDPIVNFVLIPSFGAETATYRALESLQLALDGLMEEHAMRGRGGSSAAKVGAGGLHYSSSGANNSNTPSSSSSLPSIRYECELITDGLEPKERCAKYYSQLGGGGAAGVSASSGSNANSTSTSNMAGVVAMPGLHTRAGINCTAGCGSSSPPQSILTARVVFIPTRTFCTDVLHKRIAIDSCVPLAMVLVRSVDEYYRPEDEPSFRYEREESGGAIRGGLAAYRSGHVSVGRVANAIPSLSFALELCSDAQYRQKQLLEALQLHHDAQTAAVGGAGASSSSSTDKVHPSITHPTVFPLLHIVTDSPAFGTTLLASNPRRLSPSYVLDRLKLQGGSSLHLYPRFRLDIIKYFEAEEAASKRRVALMNAGTVAGGGVGGGGGQQSATPSSPPLLDNPPFTLTYNLLTPPTFLATLSPLATRLANLLYTIIEALLADLQTHVRAMEHGLATEIHKRLLVTGGEVERVGGSGNGAGGKDQWKGKRHGYGGYGGSSDEDDDGTTADTLSAPAWDVSATLGRSNRRRKKQGAVDEYSNGYAPRHAQRAVRVPKIVVSVKGVALGRLTAADVIAIPGLVVGGAPEGQASNTAPPPEDRRAGEKASRSDKQPTAIGSSDDDDVVEVIEKQSVTAAPPPEAAKKEQPPPNKAAADAAIAHNSAMLLLALRKMAYSDSVPVIDHNDYFTLLGVVNSHNETMFGANTSAAAASRGVGGGGGSSSAAGGNASSGTITPSGAFIGKPYVGERYEEVPSVGTFLNQRPALSKTIVAILNSILDVRDLLDLLVSNPDLPASRFLTKLEFKIFNYRKLEYVYAMEMQRRLSLSSNHWQFIHPSIMGCNGAQVWTTSDHYPEVCAIARQRVYEANLGQAGVGVGGGASSAPEALVASTITPNLSEEVGPRLQWLKLRIDEWAKNALKTYDDHEKLRVRAEKRRQRMMAEGGGGDADAAFHKQPPPPALPTLLVLVQGRPSVRAVSDVLTLGVEGVSHRHFCTFLSDYRQLHANHQSRAAAMASGRYGTGQQQQQSHHHQQEQQQQSYLQPKRTLLFGGATTSGSNTSPKPTTSTNVSSATAFYVSMMGGGGGGANNAGDDPFRGHPTDGEDDGGGDAELRLLPSNREAAATTTVGDGSDDNDDVLGGHGKKAGKKQGTKHRNTQQQQRADTNTAANDDLHMLALPSAVLGDGGEEVSVDWGDYEGLYRGGGDDADGDDGNDRKKHQQPSRRAGGGLTSLRIRDLADTFVSLSQATATGGGLNPHTSSHVGMRGVVGVDANLPLSQATTALTKQSRASTTFSRASTARYSVTSADLVIPQLTAVWGLASTVAATVTTADQQVRPAPSSATFMIPTEDGFAVPLPPTAAVAAPKRTLLTFGGTTTGGGSGTAPPAHVAPDEDDDDDIQFLDIGSTSSGNGAQHQSSSITKKVSAAEQTLLRARRTHECLLALHDIALVTAATAASDCNKGGSTSSSNSVASYGSQSLNNQLTTTQQPHQQAPPTAADQSVDELLRQMMGGGPTYANTEEGGEVASTTTAPTSSTQSGDVGTAIQRLLDASEDVKVGELERVLFISQQRQGDAISAGTQHSSSSSPTATMTPRRDGSSANIRSPDAAIVDIDLDDDNDVVAVDTATPLRQQGTTAQATFSSTNPPFRYTFTSSSSTGRILTVSKVVPGTGAYSHIPQLVPIAAVHIVLNATATCAKLQSLLEANRFITTATTANTMSTTGSTTAENPTTTPSTSSSSHYRADKVFLFEPDPSVMKTIEIVGVEMRRRAVMVASTEGVGYRRTANDSSNAPPTRTVLDRSAAIPIDIQVFQWVGKERGHAVGATTDGASSSPRPQTPLAKTLHVDPYNLQVAMAREQLQMQKLVIAKNTTLATHRMHVSTASKLALLKSLGRVMDGAAVGGGGSGSPSAFTSGVASGDQQNISTGSAAPATKAPRNTLLRRIQTAVKESGEADTSKQEEEKAISSTTAAGANVEAEDTPKTINEAWERAQLAKLSAIATANSVQQPARDGTLNTNTTSNYQSSSPYASITAFEASRGRILLQLAMSTTTRLVLMDERELRSNLPFELHLRGITLLPLTLPRGDFILSPQCALERKSFPDLVGSLRNSRLAQQLTKLSEHYACPIVLIEDSDFVADSSSGGGGGAQSVTARPYRLTHTTHASETGFLFPQAMANVYRSLMRLVMLNRKVTWMWGRSPAHSAAMVARLKGLEGGETNGLGGSGRQAISRRNRNANSAGGGVTLSERVGVANPDPAISAPSGRDEGQQDAQRVAMAVLGRFPGVTATNIMPLMLRCRSLAGLALLSKEELAEAMTLSTPTNLPRNSNSRHRKDLSPEALKAAAEAEGRANAEMLHGFLHTKI